MNRLSFFTDTDLLATQLSGEFGPIDSSNYNVTSIHQAEDTGKPIPAIAVCKGQVIVQSSTKAPEGSLTFLNLIIKPFDQGEIHPFKVKYFIYKGIYLNSILDPSNTNKLISPTKNDLTKAIDKAIKKRNLADTKASAAIGFNYSSKADSDPVDSIFFDKDVDDTIVIIERGDEIGSFCPTSFGFEIVLDEDINTPTFGEFRADTNTITIPAAPSGTPASLYTASLKERILNYVDPCAFFGLQIFSNTGVRIKNSGTNYSKAEIYEHVVTKFKNKNRIYLDIRNENGYSYNYNGYYADDIIISGEQSDSAPLPSSTTYTTNGWPIKIIENGFFSSGNTTIVNKLTIKLSKGIDRDPTIDNNAIIYLSSGYFIEKFPKKNKRKFLKDASKFRTIDYVTDYTESLVIGLPNYQDSDTTPVSFYVKSFYIKKNKSYTASTPKVVPTEFFTDNLYSVLSMKNKWSTTPGNTVVLSGFSKKFIDGESTVGFSGIVETGILISTNSVIFFAYPIDTLSDGYDTPKSYAPVKGGTYKSEKTLEDVFQDIFKSRLKISKCPLNVTGSSIGTISLEADDLDSRLQYNFLAVAMTKSEYNSLLTEAESKYVYTTANNLPASGYHYDSLKIINITLQEDNNQNAYAKGDLGLTGIKENGTVFSTALTGPVTLYSDNYTFFSTKNFYDSITNADCLAKTIEFSRTDKAKVIKRLAVNGGVDKWPIYVRSSSSYIPATYTTGSKDNFDNDISGDVEIGAGTRVVLLSIKTIIISDTRLARAVNIECYYNHKFYKGWIELRAVTNLSEVYSYKVAKVTLQMTLPSNNRTDFNDPKNGNVTVDAVINDALFDIYLCNQFLTEYEITSGKFKDLVEEVEDKLNDIITKYNDSDSNKTAIVDKILMLTTKDTAVASEITDSIVQYSVQSLNNSNSTTATLIDPVKTLSNFKTILEPVIEDSSYFEDKLAILPFANLWILKDVSQNNFLSLQSFLSNKAYNLWSAITSTVVTKFYEKSTDLNPNNVNAQIKADYKGSQGLRKYVEDRINADDSTTFAQSAESKDWVMENEDLDSYDDFITISNEGIWPSSGLALEKDSLVRFHSEDFERDFNVSKRFLILDASAGSINSNNIFTVLTNELSHIDKGIKLPGDCESGYDGQNVSVCQLMWDFVKEPNNSTDNISANEVTYSGIKYKKSLKIRDLFQRNPIASVCALKGYLEYIDIPD